MVFTTNIYIPTGLVMYEIWIGWVDAGWYAYIGAVDRGNTTADIKYKVI